MHLHFGAKLAFIEIPIRCFYYRIKRRYLKYQLFRIGKDITIIVENRPFIINERFTVNLEEVFDHIINKIFMVAKAITPHDYFSQDIGIIEFSKGSFLIIHKNSNGHKRLMKLKDHYKTVKELRLANGDVLIFYLWRTPAEKLLYNEEERKELFTNIMR